MHPGVVHHVIIRGIERRKIFKDNIDRNDLVARLSQILPEANMLCYSWALMSNHAHFLFRTGDVGLSTVMRRFLTGYAVSFNRRHKRHGQVFQNRYKSIICQEDVYLRKLGHNLTDLARWLNMSQPGVGYAVSRGERIAKQNGYQLVG